MDINLSYVKKSHLKMKNDMYNSILNNQRRIMYMLQQRNTFRQDSALMLVKQVAQVEQVEQEKHALQESLPVVAPAPVPVPTISTGNKLPKKGFNVVFSKIQQ